ncbi:hypothetical protein [Salinithrix halophila]|uniref:Uncharacterized protein n=1 Tax=Salinithrix halophila TaxID=1485204 RepID=A0ABV8JBN3_9BACL
MIWLTMLSFLLAGFAFFSIFLVWFSDRETKRRGLIKLFSAASLLLLVLGIFTYPDTWGGPFREQIDYAQFRQDLLECRYDEVAYDQDSKGTFLHLKAELKNYFKSELSWGNKSAAMDDLDKAKQSCNLKVASY